MTTWSELDTRRGQLIEMAATLSRAKSMLDDVMQDYPEEAFGSGLLEQAVGLVGRAESEIDAAAEEMER
jgi:hypothetical protein